MLIRLVVATIFCGFVLCIRGEQQTAAGKSCNGSPPVCQSLSMPQSSDLVEADRLTNSAIKLYKEGKYSDALPLAKRAMEIREKALGVDHPLVSAALINVAELYIAQGKYSDALPLYSRAVQSNEKRLGPDHQNMAPLLDKLASLYGAKGDSGEMESLYKRALDIRERKFGQNHPEVAISLYRLGRFYRLSHEYEKAATLLMRAVAIMDKTSKPDDSAYFETLEEYSLALQLFKRGDDALEVKKRILRIRNPTLSNASSEIYIGKALSLPKPSSFPASVRGTQGNVVVIVRVTIDERGYVINARAESGDTALMEAVEATSRKARFEPTLMGGIPVKVTGIITYNFVAQ